MGIDNFKHKVNDYTAKGIPYLFLLDYELEKPFICKLTDLEEQTVFYNIKGNGNLKSDLNKKSVPLSIKSFSKKKYITAFNLVMNQIVKGNSYLLNLTFANKIKSDNSLLEIIQKANSSYKLYFKNEFISFSPESFIQIKNNKIVTFPMKGTINATIPNAKEIILNDAKETNEHNTIVDLMRNDLAMVASNITINKFRYIDKIKTQQDSILQVSSEIEGTLSKNWKSNFGEIILKLLPAGSISGAPKPKTIAIIKEVEQEKRGYYTGIFGVFDGNNIDSAVLIRYIENENGKLTYRSGGGITSQSNANSEYNEMLQKIYIPV